MRFGFVIAINEYLIQVPIQTEAADAITTLRIPSGHLGRPRMTIGV